jgi:hypothetical protein
LKIYFRCKTFNKYIPYQLRIGYAARANCDNYAEFADDGSISDCQTLLQVGHSKDLIRSIFVGRAAYSCVKDLVRLGPVKTWEDFPFEKNLDPSIPIIQCNGFLCRKGCSVGPIFNTQGKVVELVVGEFDNCQTAIH